MLKYFPLIVLIAFGCTKPKADLEVYFDLEALLSEQVVALDILDVKLEKSVFISGQTESMTLSPDSTGWVDQFDLLTDFSPSIPAYVGAFVVSKTEQEESYKIKENQRSPLKSFSIRENAGEKIITAELLENKGIYTDYKQMKIILRNELLEAYSISGYQKMMLKDTIRYTIEAKVITP